MKTKRSTMHRHLLLITLAVLLAGCEQFFGTTKIIHLDATAPMSDQDQKVVVQRLHEHTSTFSPTYNITNSPGKVTILAKGTPDDSSIRYLLSHSGLFRARTEGGVVLFSQDDIVDARAGFDNHQRTALHLKLSKQAGARLAAISSANTGRFLTAEFDGAILTSAKIVEPILEGLLQLTINRSPEEALMISTILRSGPLSFSPTSIQIESQQ